MWRRLTRYLLRRRETGAELDEELRSHLAMERQRRLEMGATPEAARSEALQDFGSVLLVEEVTREMWGWQWLMNLGQDLRHALRLLRTNPGFTTVVVLSLALGIGANTAIFQLLDAVRLRSLPVDRPGELADVSIAGGNGGLGLNPGNYGGLTRPMWEAARREQKAFSGLAAWSLTGMRLGGGSERKRIRGLEVSGEFFSVLHVAPWRGRLFNETDEAIACPANLAVASYGFWQREMGGRELGPDAKLVANGQLYEVIGVTPPEFHGVAVGETFDLAIPMCLPNKEPRRDVFSYSAIGRLRPGWTVDRAAAHLETISPGVMESTMIQGYGDYVVKRYREYRLTAVRSHNGVSRLRSDYDRSLWLLLGMTGLVLLIACANLANLMLARSSAREREIAVRLSLGASRGRLLRQFFAETALLAAIGMVLGVALAQVVVRALVVSLTTEENSIHLALGLDWRVLLFAGAAAVATCLLFGALPAARVTRMQPDSVLRAGGRGLTTSRQRFSMQRILVVTQVAVSMVLLSGALLFARSFRNLATFDPGLRQRGITVAQLGLSERLPEGRLESFHREIVDLAAAVPGVRSVASTTHLPLWGGAWSHGLEIGAEKGWARFSWVSERYFDTMAIPLLAGRGFDSRDTRSSKRVAVVNETFVKRYCGGANPIGKTLRTGAEPGFPSTLYEIVGVIPETRYSGLRDGGQAMVFAPAPQFPQLAPWANLMIYSETPHAATVAAVKARLAARFPELVMDFVDFRKRIEDGMTQERLMATLSGFFGALAVTLAIVGLYGVVSYMTARRRNEIGIRVALGAGRMEVIRMILRDSAWMLLPGLAIGVALSLLATQGARKLLFGIEPWDAGTLIGSAVLLAVVAVLASWIPARRAAGLDPLTALRHE